MKTNEGERKRKSKKKRRRKRKTNDSRCMDRTIAIFILLG